MSGILVADDSPPIRLLMRRRLEMAGHEVVEAEDGREAITRLEEPGEDGMVEVVILDAAMPKLTGAEALVLIGEKWPDIPVIGLSASLDLSEQPEWDGAADFFGKPIDFERLLERIEELTSGPPRP